MLLSITLVLSLHLGRIYKHTYGSDLPMSSVFFNEEALITVTLSTPWGLSSKSLVSTVTPLSGMMILWGYSRMSDTIEFTISCCRILSEIPGIAVKLPPTTFNVYPILGFGSDRRATTTEEIQGISSES